VSIHTSTESLERLVQTLDLDLGDVDELPTGESASIVRVLNNGEIAIKSLDGEHPFDALIGFCAPDDWEVFGVIAPGWGTYYAGPQQGERRRVRAIHVVSRRGEEASLLRFAGDTATTIARETHVPGRVADCIRRAMNVATQPEPEESVLAFWWDRVMQALVARNHPSFERRPVDVAEIDALIGDRPATWSDERWRVVEADGNAHMDGAVAAWMDDGMFARFMLAELGDPDVAIPAARRACTPDAWDYLLQCFAYMALTDDIVIDDEDDEDEPF
jgi:hypothetical protein